MYQLFAQGDKKTLYVKLTLIRYGDLYRSLQPRIAKTLLQAFMDVSKPLTTHYGSIVGITALGHEAIEMLLLPNIAKYYKTLEPEMNSTDPAKQSEARKCYSALLVIHQVIDMVV